MYYLLPAFTRGYLSLCTTRRCRLLVAPYYLSLITTCPSLLTVRVVHYNLSLLTACDIKICGVRRLRTGEAYNCDVEVSDDVMGNLRVLSLIDTGGI